MLNYRLGTVNAKHWGFNPVFRCSKPHTFTTFSGEEKERSIHSFQQGRDVQIKNGVNNENMSSLRAP